MSLATTRSRQSRATSPPVRVGIVGAFDVADIGELLIHDLTRHELTARIGAIDLRAYGSRAMSATAWPFEVHSQDALRAELGDLALLLIAGRRAITFREDGSPGSDAGDPQDAAATRLWIGATLLALAAGTPVVWNALRIASGTPGWAADLLAAAIGAVDHVSVRDESSRDEIRNHAPNLAIPSAPDPLLGIGALTASAGEDRRTALRSELGVDGPYVVIDAAPASDAFAAMLRNAVREARQAGRRVVSLSDPAESGAKALDLGVDAIVVGPWSRPLETAALIGDAEGIVTYRPDLMRIAIAQGVHVFRIATPGSSAPDAPAAFGGLSTVDASARSLGTRMARVRRSAARAEVAEAAAQLPAHWDRVATMVGSKLDQARRWQALAHVIDVATVTLGELARASETRERQRDALVEQLTSVEASRLAASREIETLTDASAEARAEREALRRRADDADESASVASERLTQLERVAAEADAAAARATSTIRHLRDELTLRDTKLSENARQLKSLASDLAKVRRELDAVRNRRSVRAALRVAGVARQIRLAVRPPPSTPNAPSRAAKRGTTPVARREASAEDQRSLAATITASVSDSDRTGGPRVSIVVLTRDGREDLRRLVAGLETTVYRNFELIVVDNASSDGTAAFLEGLKTTFDLKVVVNDENRPFSEGSNQGVHGAGGDLVLLLNNDIEPVTPGWLGTMVTTLEQEPGAVAVGARLIYPRRPGLDNVGDRTFDDLTLQHRGIAFTGADGHPVARNLGAGEDPMSDAAAARREVPALTGACLLVDRQAFDAAGGLTEGFVYGTEDVDLCLKLRARGGRLIYDGGAVLWHHEYRTQNVAGAAWKRENRRINRQLFVDRWGPQLFREVFLDRVKGERRWSEEPLHVGITVTRDDPAAGWGDYYTAHELGDACQAMGWRVSYLERYADRWYDVDPGLDVAIALLDAFDIGRLPRKVVSVAWVRNWTERWLSHPWFDDYDLVFASSARSRELIEANSSLTAQLMPLATNPERFARTPASAELATDVVFVGNHWGEARGVLDRLPTLPREVGVRVFGKGWEDTALAHVHGGVLPYARLPAAYSSARVVVDDTAGPTMPYGAVNARVFDALATGAVVVSDNELGIAELFDAEFPVARDAAEFPQVVSELLADPARSAQLAQRYQAIVLAQHTYSQRAVQFRDALVAWAEADRVAILIGAPDRAQAPAWGDYHFAHGLQRQLIRQGMPTRVELLPDWERAPTARADIVIHLFGLSEYRTRPSQMNLLWVISHPDLARDGLCDRYDHVFVASDPFAAGLAQRIGVPVSPLHQATDPDRFRPDPVGPAHDVLYVANSRKNRRRMIDDLRYTNIDVAVYGRHWTADLIDLRLVRGEHIPNDVLNQYYSAAKIVLNDHWDDMRRHGFIANRIYDALASGTLVISDDVPGMDEEFDGAVVTYRLPEELHGQIEHFLAHDDERAARAARGRAAVLARHTFGHRARVIQHTITGLKSDVPRGVSQLDRLETWLARRSRRRTGRHTIPVMATEPIEEHVRFDGLLAGEREDSRTSGR